MDDPFEKALEAHKAHDYEAAIRGYRAVIHLRNARHNLGALLNQLGRLDEAEAALRPIVEQFPDFAPSRFSLAMVLLAQARYAEGWDLYEARRSVGNAGIFDPQTSAPEWRGEPLAGRRIVVCAEQGYGDQIMFARYLGALRDAGADVVVGCNSVVAPLFAGLGWPVTPFAVRRRQLAACDYWVLMGSLPLRLGMQGPPPPAPGAWPKASGGGGIGVVPSGSPKHLNDARRSLPPDMAERLLALGRDLRPEATGARDFRQSAEIMACLDLVISVDTAAVHLAASLGVETWVLLPEFGTDWRWGRARNDCAWYASTRLLRQPRLDDWASVLDAITRRLESSPAPGR